LEKEVDFILVKSGMKEEDLQKYEDIQLSKLSVDEVAARRRELRQERMKLETARAKERMTLKHKNTSKWAKQALKHGRHDLENTMKREKKATQQLIDDFIEDLEDNDFSDDGTCSDDSSNARVSFNQGPGITTNPTAFTQRELVARAFANDNVVEIDRLRQTSPKITIHELAMVDK
ncbi:24469_t:CDS:2, partial [Gigaspora rosea]